MTAQVKNAIKMRREIYVRDTGRVSSAAGTDLPESPGNSSNYYQTNAAILNQIIHFKYFGH